MSKNIKKIIFIMALAIVMTALVSITAFAARDAVGDLNRDGEKDENDALHLLYHTYFSNKYEVDQPCDYNGDGVIDDKDALYLLYNTYFPNKYYICEHTADKWSVKEVVAPTCKEKGYTVMICECGEEEITNYTDITDEHVWGEPNYDNAATCLENGYITETCTVCGKVNTTQQQAIGHDWTKGSCTEAKTCKNCDATVAALGHIFGTEPVESEPATCKGGYNIFKCENCDETTKVDLEPVDHTVKEDAWKFTREDAVEGAKCTYVYVEQNTCTICGETVERSSESFVKHNETTSVTEATCVTKGEKIVSCKDCGVTLKNETIEINTNHNWVEDTEKSTATVTAYKCDAEGCTATKTAAKLSADGKVDIGTAEEVELDNGAAIIPDEKTKEQLGGTSVSVSVDTVDADEIGLGEDEKALLDGAPIYNLEMADENDKPITDFDGTMTVRLPYELSEGDDPDCIIIWYIKDDGSIEYYEAKYINGYAVFETTHFSYYTVTRMTPAQRCAAYGHNYETTLVPATCVTGGYTLDICTRCGDKQVSVPVAALGHDWEVSVTKSASCTDKGTETHTCKRCDIEFEKSIGALGHSYKAEEELGVTDRYVEPSCAANGEHYMVCERCDKEYKEDLAQLEHEYDTEVVDADCDNGGYKKYKCKHCGDEYESEHTKPNGHVYDKDGICVHCKKECAHEYKYGVCSICGCEKEKPAQPEEPKPEEPDHKHTLDVTFEFINEDLRYCELGVIITEKCTTCDYENTFTTFEHYTWEVNVDLSEYDICESHAIHYIRCACVEGEMEWIEDPDFKGETTRTETSMSIKCYDCAFSVEAVMYGEETDCYEMYYQKMAFKVDDKDVHVIEAMLKETYHVLEDTTVKFDKNGSICTDGVTVKGTCSVCGEAVEYKLYNHYTVLTEKYDLAQYGACEVHSFTVSQCPCGAEKYASVRGFDSANHTGDPFGNQIMEYCCEDCNVTVERIVKESAADQSCMFIREEIYNVKANGEIKESVTITTTRFSHEMKITEIDYAEGSSSCEEGLVITETCVNCGISETYSSYGHRYVYEDLDLSEYKVCGHHYVSVEKCVGCGKIDHINYGNFDHWSEGVLYCGACDLYIWTEESYGEKNEKCEVEVVEEIKVGYGNEILAECGRVYYRTNHSIEITYELAEGATNCEEGLIITERCADCGWEATYDQYEHYMQETYLVFPEGSVCDYHNVYVYRCVACDYVDNYGFDGSLDGNSEKTENGFKDTLFCPDCNLIIVEEYSMIETGKPCETLTKGTVSIYAGNELFYEGYTESRWMRHEYEYTVELMDGATTCEEGIVIINTCKNCGYSYRRNYYGHYTEFEELDLSEYGVCEYHTVNVVRCLCCGMVEHMKYDGLVSQKVNGEWVYTCADKACDLRIQTRSKSGDKNEFCEVQVTRQYMVICGGETILSFVEEYINTNHNYEVSFEFLGESGSCEDGYIACYTCKDCGASEQFEEWGHQAYTIKTLYLSDYGHKCGTGSFGVSSCPCGYEWHTYVSEHDTFAENWKREEINGVVYGIYVYTCADCGFEYERRISTTKDEFCNSTSILEYVIYGETVYSATFVGGAKHSYTEKDLPDESYWIENEDGSYLEVIAREEYCADCFASISKYVITMEYSADRSTIFEKRDFYEYVALNEKETIAVLTSSYANTYHKVEYVLGEGYIYACDTSENYYYDENGNVISWEKYEYIYENGNYCDYTVKITTSNDKTRTETVENDHSEYIGKFVLAEGSESCTDGVQYVYYCALCGKEVGREDYIYYSHQIDNNCLMEKDRTDLKVFGAVCDSYIVVYSCACGEAIDYDFDSECDFGMQFYEDYDENDIRHEYRFYTCAVTDPKTCGVKFVVETYYTPDSECNEIVHVNFYIGLNETNDSCQKKMSYEYKTGGKMHNNIDVVETITDERYYSTEMCLDCGILLQETEIKDNIKTYTSYEYYNENGSLRNKNIQKYIYPMVYGNEKHIFTRNESYDSEGKLTYWSQYERSYPYADEGNYCFYNYVDSNIFGENETGSKESHSIHWYGSGHCTPAMTQKFCQYCDYTEWDWDYNNGHYFEYDFEKNVYVCVNCELESEAGGNGDVTFEDYTFEEGDENSYVIGWVNNYGDSYIWSVALVVEGSDELIFLDDIKVDEIGEYRLGVDAAAIRKIAAEYGIAPCDYMVRIAFVPTDSDGSFDYAITLDPHVFVEDPDNTVIPEKCGEYVYAYKCAFCDETKTEIFKGHYFEGSENSYVGFNDEGYWTITIERSNVCVLCGYETEESSYQIYYPNGMLKEEVRDNYRFVYEYDYVNGYLYEYDEYFSNGEVQRIENRAFDISSDNYEIIYYYWEEDGNSGEFEYIWVNGVDYSTLEKHSYSYGWWDSFEREYNFEEDILTVTYTNSNGDREVNKYYISTGEQITE